MTNITSWTELNAIRNDLDGDYQLMNNLSSIDEDYTDIGDSWVPIGNLLAGFSGTFNGLGHTISDLIVSQPEGDYAGLFGILAESSSVSNIGLINVNISGKNEVGGLVGNNSGTILNSYVTGNVTNQEGSGNRDTGGLIGYNQGIVNNSYSIVDVTGNSNVGGLIGTFEIFSEMSNCYATGIVTGNSNVGGLIGVKGFDMDVSFDNCGWFRNSSGAIKAIGYDSETDAPIELITYNIKVGGGAGYIDDTVDWFYDKTRDIYDTTSPIWDFTTPIWYEHATEYPNFVSDTPTGPIGPFPTFKRV